MSLTSFLNDNADVREAFRKEFEKPRMAVKKDLVAPPFTENYSQVGTAFDYLLRFYVQRHNRNTIDKGYWVAELSVDLLVGDRKLQTRAQKIVDDARRHLAEYLRTDQMTDALVKSALLLAGLDPIYRAGLGHDKIGLVNTDDMRDLGNLISAVDPNIFSAKSLCLVNPTFGRASALVGGADADLVIDDAIIDIKTTVNPSLSRHGFDQLLGYYVLHEIGGVGELRPKPKITKVAIYFSRHAHLYDFQLKHLIDPKTFPRFVDWFKERAASEFL